MKQIDARGYATHEDVEELKEAAAEADGAKKGGAPLFRSRTEEARKAGMSKRQTDTAVRVANVPEVFLTI